MPHIKKKNKSGKSGRTAKGTVVAHTSHRSSPKKPGKARRPKSYGEKFGKNAAFFGTDIPIKQRFRTRRILKRAFWSLFVAGLLLGLLLTLTCFWTVSTVSVKGGARYTVEELADASGIQTGDLMMSFDTATVAARLRAACPLLKSVRLDRSLNGEVTISVTEEERLYYTCHNQNYYLLSAESFRVLEVSGQSDRWIDLGPVYLGLPEEARLRRQEVLTFDYLPYLPSGAGDELVTYEVETGRAEEQYAYVYTVLDAVMNSPLSGRITGLELGNRYNLWLVLDGRIKVMLGSVSELDRKLSLIMVVLDGQASSGTLPALLDVSDPTEVGYRESEEIDLPEWVGH